MDTTNSSRELHLTVANEDYLECVVRIENEEGETNGVRSVDIAQRLGVSKASVNKAVSALKASELVEQSHYGKVSPDRPWSRGRHGYLVPSSPYPRVFGPGARRRF